MKVKTIRQAVEFGGVSPQEVYDTLMNSKSHGEATGSTAKIGAKVGGKFTAWDGYILGENVELVKGKKIVQKWRTTEWPDGAEDSVLEIVLSATPKGTKRKPLLRKGASNRQNPRQTIYVTGTKLTMTHSNVPAEQADSYAQGWKDCYWKPMKKYFAGKTKE